MAKEIKEVVQRINSWYVGEDCAQIMIPYKNTITILDKNGIVYHYKEGSELFVNNYMNDERRQQFPYHSIPTHSTKFAFNGRLHYTNQLFNFEEPYIRINDGHIMESYVVKDKNEALAVTKVMTLNKSTSFKTREELERMFEEQTTAKENTYLLYGTGAIISDNKINIASEQEIFEYIKRNLSKNLADFKKYVEDEPYSTVGSYLRKNDFFLEFVERNINSFDLKDYRLNLRLIADECIILVKTDGVNISIECIEVYFIAPNYYRVDTYDLPVTKYTLEQLKYLTPKIEKTKEPRITLKINPSISREDIIREKRLVRQLKKQQ